LDTNIKEINSTFSVVIPKETFSTHIESSKSKKRKIKTNDAVFIPIQIEAVDEGIDPNETLYCICRQVSFGRMVGCDNENCTVEVISFQKCNIKIQLLCLYIA